MKIKLVYLVLYYNLPSDAESRYPYEEIKKAAEEHQDFLKKFFTIRNEEGQHMQGEVLRVDMLSIPKRGVFQSELIARNVYYHIKFPLTPPRTLSLSLRLLEAKMQFFLLSWN